MIHISLNQDQSYFSVGTQKGFKVYKLGLDITEEISREFGAGIGIIEMVHKTNIFALVGGGKIPRYHRNKLLIWDDGMAACI